MQFHIVNYDHVAGLLYGVSVVGLPYAGDVASTYMLAIFHVDPDGDDHVVFANFVVKTKGIVSYG